MGNCYEKDIDNGNVKEKLYLGGDYYSAPAVYVKQGSGSWQLYYICRDYLGSIVALADSRGSLKQELSYDAWGRVRNPSNQITYAPDKEPVLFLGRGYTGHEHLPCFGLINMNGRLYDPAVGRFLSPDNYVQLPDFTQNFNRYSYCLNNPLKYNDPDGELFWLPIIIGAAIFGTANVVIQANNGEIDNFWSGLNAFVGGAVTGAIIGATWTLGIAGVTSSHTLAKIGGWTIVAGKGVNAVSTIASTIADPGNAAEIWFGRGYTDGNRNMLGQVWQGISRYTWEGLQTFGGYNYSQWRNACGNVDRVDYLGGATFATDENSGSNKGVSLGNFSNIWIKGTINKANFRDYVISDPLYMHEYGHTFDSRRYGLAYLLAVGIPSAISAANATKVAGEPSGVTNHDFRRYEMRANRDAARYFKKHYGVDWNINYRNGTIETYYPRNKR